MINLFDASLLLTFLSIALAGAVVWLLVLKKQVTEQVNQAEKKLSKYMRADPTMGHLGKFFDESPNPFLRLYSDGAILYHNKASTRILNMWGNQRALPKTNYWYEYVQKTFNSGRPQQGEIKCGDQTFSLTFVPAVDSTCVDVHGLDITKRKKAEEKLRKKGEQFRAIAGYAYDMESWRGPDGRL